jgi:hypothetical protein
MTMRRQERVEVAKVREVRLVERGERAAERREEKLVRRGEEMERRERKLTEEGEKEVERREEVMEERGGRLEEEREGRREAKRERRKYVRAQDCRRSGESKSAWTEISATSQLQPAVTSRCPRPHSMKRRLQWNSARERASGASTTIFSRLRRSKGGRLSLTLSRAALKRVFQKPSAKILLSLQGRRCEQSSGQRMRLTERSQVCCATARSCCGSYFLDFYSL